ncbi:hypothetical protein MMB232_00119 [Brevundimonas subvibrioides]|uniref:hypothetical protein n=1 Tax=Brevundimonas subvibrioides TaxID=74313 RepID=UPI0032D56AAF
MTAVTPTSTTPLPAAQVSAREQKVAERDRARLAEARSAVETLKANGAGRTGAAAEERKAQARKKVEQLKARLKMMQMSAAANPKALAQIARELKAAIKAYGGAGGSTAGLDAGSPADMPSSGPSVTPEGAASAAGPPGAEAGGESPAPTTDDGSPDAAGTDPSKDGGGADARGATSDPYRRMAEAALARGAEASRRGAHQDADRDFLSGVRELAAILESLARRAVQEAKVNPSLGADADEALKASDAVDKAITEAAGDLGAAGVSILA